MAEHKYGTLEFCGIKYGEPISKIKELALAELHSPSFIDMVFCSAGPLGSQ